MPSLTLAGMADVIVGRFALIDLIAKGGSGAVWRAWDKKVDNVCAAKVLRQRDSADLMRFVREKGVSFDHPNLLTPYGWGAEDEHVVIAMPLASGGTLDGLIKRGGPLGEAATVVILSQLLKGLQHIHNEQWIHRDVKPGNIMFDVGGPTPIHSRLADFGIAVHETDVRFTHVGMINGTPGFMAPELFQMDEPTPKQDLYAAGVVALMMLNGRFTLNDGPIPSGELARLLKGVSPQLAGVIRSLVEADPVRRCPSAQAAIGALPYVAPQTPLVFADGTPIRITSLMPPLPPGFVREKAFDVDQNKSASMEALRAGAANAAGMPVAQWQPTPATPRPWERPTGPRTNAPRGGAPAGSAPSGSSAASAASATPAASGSSAASAASAGSAPTGPRGTSGSGPSGAGTGGSHAMYGYGAGGQSAASPAWSYVSGPSAPTGPRSAQGSIGGAGAPGGVVPGAAGGSRTNLIAGVLGSVAGLVVGGGILGVIAALIR
ncbi:serine/threonine-protein kinase [Helcobacillus massiliensis]